MKLRTGFVANSSSSSFVVAFDSIPCSLEEMKQMLFGEDEYYFSPYSDEKYSALKVAQIVFDDIKMSLNKDQLIKEFEDVSNIDYNDSKFKNKKGEIDWNKINKYSKIEDEKEMKRFFERNKGKYFYSFTYSDEDGSLSSAMEHGDLFKNFDYTRISHH